jgi:hypothetical protein
MRETSVRERLGSQRVCMSDPSIDKKLELARVTTYPEICRSHHAIAEFRGKLLALLPIASGAGLFLLLGDAESKPADGDLIGIGLFGFVVTFGLFLYDLHGIQDCILLRRRGEKIEERLELDPRHSHFRQWPPAALRGLVNEIGAGWVIYTAVMTSWLYVAGSGINAWDDGRGGILAATYVLGLLAYWLFRLRHLDSPR